MDQLVLSIHVPGHKLFLSKQLVTNTPLTLPSKSGNIFMKSFRKRNEIEHMLHFHSAHSIYTSPLVPLNQTAQRVIARAQPIHHFTDLAPRDPISDDNAIRIQEILSKQHIYPLPTDIRDWTNIVLDRITVIAYSHSRPRPGRNGQEHLWLVRCVCGTYRLQQHKTLQRIEKGRRNGLCSDCLRTIEIQKLASQS